MPDDIGEMFYSGQTPWHGKGLALARPATLEQALKAGALDWQVGEVDLLTADDPPSPVPTRKAIVRLDRPPGHPRRVLGVAHRGFQPVQNRDGALLFDAIFGRGGAVYETGGYLRDGQVVWLLAQIGEGREIAANDAVVPYALFANSHDGSMAFNIRLTTVRVVCQNTLAMAMDEQQFGRQFRRPHQGGLRQHADAAQQFFASTLRQFDHVTNQFVMLSRKRCSNDNFDQIMTALLPEPRKPRNIEANPGLRKAWEANIERIEKAKTTIRDLRDSGKGMHLDGSRGTFWGLLNAILEFVDHHQPIAGSRVAYALLGDGMDLKSRAFREIIKKAA